MCVVVINVLKPSEFNVESQYFIPLFYRISWFCGQHPRGDETSNQAQQGMTFHIILIFTFKFLPWKLDLSQYVKTNPILKLAVKWKPGQFSPPMKTLINLILLIVDIFDSHL
jgi:hypothetical protein